MYVWKYCISVLNDKKSIYSNFKLYFGSYNFASSQNSFFLDGCTIPESGAQRKVGNCKIIVRAIVLK